MAASLVFDSLDMHLVANSVVAGLQRHFSYCSLFIYNRWNIAENEVEWLHRFQIVIVGACIKSLNR